MSCLFALLVSALVVGGGCTRPGGGQGGGAALGRQEVTAATIPDEAAFMRLSRREGDERFIKYVLDLRTDEVIYFDVNVYPMHLDFVFERLYREPITYARHMGFNENYGRVKPEFLLGYVVQHGALGLWTFTFWEGDQLSAAHVERAWGRLKATFYAGERLAFRPDSTLHEALLPSLPSGLAVVRNDEIYQRLPYVALTTGRAVGRLRLLAEGDDPWTLRPDEVVIVRATLADLPRVAGIISASPASPLSHVALRARAWGAPHIYVKGAVEALGALVGEVVILEADAEGHRVRVATEAEVEAWRAAQAAPPPVRVPRADLGPSALTRLEDLTLRDLPAFGAKTAHLGQLTRCARGRVWVPPGFGVPIHHYAAHMRRNGLDAELEAILGDAGLLADPARLSERLRALQGAIRAAPLDAGLLEALGRAAAALGDHGLFVRSSTNAEDLPDFNGAGLYETVPNVRGVEALAEALKQVWASAWSPRAFQERALSGIDQRQVYAAALVQVGVNADAAGVLVTRDVFNPRDTQTLTINAKRGLGGRVVEGERVAEQLLYDPENGGIKVISRSDDAARLTFDPEGGVRLVPDPDHGQPVLSDAQVRALGDAAALAVGCFPYAQPLDMEWLLAGGRLAVVQARPLLEAGRSP